MTDNISEERWNLGVEAAYLAGEAYDVLVEAREVLGAVVKIHQVKPIGVEVREEGLDAATLKFAGATREFRDYDAIVGQLIGRETIERTCALVPANPSEEEKDFAYTVSGLEKFGAYLYEQAYLAEYGNKVETCSD